MAVKVDGFDGIACVIRRRFRKRGVSYRDIVMIGDNTVYTVLTERVHPLKRKDYCGQCGQIGCGHDGLER